MQANDSFICFIVVNQVLKMETRCSKGKLQLNYFGGHLRDDLCFVVMFYTFVCNTSFIIILF